jgi:hypothetical protein
MTSIDEQGNWKLEVLAEKNGRLRKGVVDAFHLGEKKWTDESNLQKESERRRVARRLAELMGSGDVKQLEQLLADAWIAALNTYQQEENAKAAVEATVPPPTALLQLLDGSPSVIRRPLCLLDGKSYAATWATVKCEIQGVVSEDQVLLIVDRDGKAYTDGAAPDAEALGKLQIPVRLPTSLTADRCWSGAGVKRYQAGERPDPGVVFGQVVAVIDRFLDFNRSLTDQDRMCELVACYVMATYFLDAFHVIGYLWPNGERGCGKTTFLHVIAEMGYLGQVILAGSTYACLRDFADYGAVLAFDDAEAVMDRRADPDKRALLLAGNRKGCTVSVKEPAGERGWVIRYIDTFCPRLFSAIRLPDEVLSSRSIIVPLIRSGDAQRSKANVLDGQTWPCNRRRLLDDLWALGLAYLPDLPAHDRDAARATDLAGRNLEPWRAIFAVSHWLEHEHGHTGLFERMKKLADTYQTTERPDFESNDRVRILYRVLWQLCQEQQGDEITIIPGTVASAMCTLALNEDLGLGDKPFITSKALGYLLKRQRFQRAKRTSQSKGWTAKKQDILAACKDWGVDEAGSE